MILAILNNPRLGLNLLVVWLILGVGLLPDTTEGLKCYKCDGAACKSAPPDTDCTTGYCLTINKGKDSEKKDCAASAKEGECIQKMGGCFTGTDDNKADMETCLGTEAKTDVGTGTEICVCEGDHCNGEKKDDKKTDDKKDDKKVDDTTPAPAGNAGKCYKCYGVTCDEENVPELDCPLDLCVITSAKGVVTDKGCYHDAELANKCYKEKKCLTKPEEIECTGKKGPGTDEMKTCVCKGKLCNTGGTEGDAEQMISNGFLVYLLAMMGISAI